MKPDLLLRVRTCERGSQVIELALALPILLVILSGVAEFGLLFRTLSVTANAAREGARIAIVPGNEYNDALVEARVNAYLQAAGVSGVPDVEIERPEITVGGVPTTAVRVTVNYTYDALFLDPIIGLVNGTFADTVTLQSTAVMRTQPAPAGP
jgi:Flp pilus assembly protein TadG